MNCPFLHEAQVRYCHAAPLRKPLMQIAPAAEERCSSREWVDCAVWRGQTAPDKAADRCPFLHIGHVQFCTAASWHKPVPYSESTLIRCGQVGFRYCEAYLSFARPVPVAEESVDGIEVPRRLRYTPNHMWIDVAEDGSWRAGIDGLFAHALGSLDAITFLTDSGRQKPAAVLTAAGFDLAAVFPHVLPIAGCNVYLRADPSRVVASPYTAGWLFRGDSASQMMDDLIPGDQAGEWMEKEIRRASAFVHDRVQRTTAGFAADGGTLEEGLLQRLTRDDRLRFGNMFFSFFA
jgi:glycine cleavage system H lipoate-binding protein